MVDAFAFSPYRFDWLSNTYLSNANDDQPDGPSSNEPEPGMNEAHVLDRLTVGIPEIDADHQRLMEHYQALIQTLEPGQDISAFAQSFDGFLQEVDEHFEREEAIMLVLRYDDYDQHRAEHRNSRVTPSTLSIAWPTVTTASTASRSPGIFITGSSSISKPTTRTSAASSHPRRVRDWKRKTSSVG
ncbi:MAG: hemerythrin domain-containing protein [Hyphomicrobiales bacterium]|nr:hemerythrin domain-containing protein [Hyphomicrobiales bacterium]